MVQSSFTEEGRNYTSVTMFFLLGVADEKELKLILFPIFLVIYLVTVTWNLCLIILIRMDSHLHTPMYFFLSCLSLIDLIYTASTSPKMLSDFFRDKKAISFIGCATQYCVSCSMGMTECGLLASMAYDRYVAIGNPLQYSAIMAPGRCWKLVIMAFGCGFLSCFIETVTCFEMNFCGPNLIQNFFCNITEIINLSCSNPFVIQTIILVATAIIVVGSLLIILLSYVFIVVSILKLSSGKGSAKAFNTCASHLAVVTLFYGTGLSVYMNPSTGQTTKQNKYLSIFYMLVIPMLNPLIYSLRNKEIKEALRRVTKKAVCLSR